MSTLHRIALLGFSAFERSTLASYFRLASTREPRYEQVQALPQADFVVADGEHEASVRVVLAGERLPETVFVGARAPEGAIAWLQRPIDPMRVLRELDVLAGRRMQPLPAQTPPVRAEVRAETRKRTIIQPVRPQRPVPPEYLLLQPRDSLDLTLDLALPDAAEEAAASEAVPVATLAAAEVVPFPIIGLRQPMQAARPAWLPVRVPASAVAASPPPEPQRAAAAAPSTALLVDDSDVALRSLQRKLAPFGLVTDCASHSAAAIERLARRRYDFVFLDLELGDGAQLEGLDLCQRIKRDRADANVVVVTAHHTELDRVRGALAGCDGFLGKPLDEEELALYLARYGVRAAANAGCVPS